MSVLATFEVPAEDFVLGRALGGEPSFEVTLESMVQTGDGLAPLFSVHSTAATLAEEALADDPDVERIERAYDVGDRTLFRMEWADGVDGIVDAVEDTGAVVLAAVGTDGRWRFRIRFPDGESLSTFYRTCLLDGVDLTPETVHTAEENDQQYGLTPEQHRALAVAVELGYYAVPRDVTLSEVADELGISGSAASQRLRRGLSALVATTLSPE